MSDLLVPTDGCEKCMTIERGYPVHPYQVIIEGDALYAWYRCWRCGHSWWTGWHKDYATLPCPGCELCQPLGGAA